MSNIDAVSAPYYLLERAWAQVAGLLASLRFPSSLAMAGCALLGALGKRLASVRVGVVAALLLAALPSVSRYGQEARPYAFAMAASCAALLLLLRAGSSLSGVCAGWRMRWPAARSQPSTWWPASSSARAPFVGRNVRRAGLGAALGAASALAAERGAGVSAGGAVRAWATSSARRRPGRDRARRAAEAAADDLPRPQRGHHGVRRPVWSAAT